MSSESLESVTLLLTIFLAHILHKKLKRLFGLAEKKNRARINQMISKCVTKGHAIVHSPISYFRRSNGLFTYTYYIICMCVFIHN